MKVSRVILGKLQTNCYVLVDEMSGLGAVVDPAEFSNQITDLIEASEINQLKYIFLTHGHIDHVLGAYDLKQKYPDAQVVISAEDEICLSSEACSLASDWDDTEQIPMHADICVHDGDSLQLGTESVQVISTPGHTPGSVCYLIGNTMFSGDTLFYKTCGRTDLFRGDFTVMQDSIMKLGNLPGDYIVYPGHGGFTTLDAERKSNRFMRKTKWSLI